MTTNRLEANGIPHPAAIARATAIVRADLHNDRRLSSPPPTPRCAICGEGDRERDPLLPVLSPDPARPHWVHGGECHAALRDQIADRVADIIEGASA